MERYEGGWPAFDGLIRDWNLWWLQSKAGRESPFHLFADVLDRLSHPEEKMAPGEPRRIYLNDSIDCPTVDLPYDNVPIIHLSAGMRRVLGLAYLIVWTWTEHVEASRLLGFEPARRVVLVVDEVERNVRSGDMLDPCEIEDDWFEILLPSLPLVVTERRPAPLRPTAELMLKRLRLGNGPQVMRSRQAFYAMYQPEEPATLALLDRYAPLVARAIRKAAR